MEELKKCPFCGGAASVISKHQGLSAKGNFAEGYEVGCRSCGANIARKFQGEFFRKGSEFFIVKDGYSDAVKAWNTRAGDA